MQQVRLFNKSEQDSYDATNIQHHVAFLYCTSTNTQNSILGKHMMFLIDFLTRVQRHSRSRQKCDSITHVGTSNRGRFHNVKMISKCCQNQHHKLRIQCNRTRNIRLVQSSPMTWRCAMFSEQFHSRPKIHPKHFSAPTKTCTHREAQAWRQPMDICPWVDPRNASPLTWALLVQWMQTESCQVIEATTRFTRLSIVFPAGRRAPLRW